MIIDKQKCRACKACHPYCPVGAISLVPWDKGKMSEVSQADCVECAPACVPGSVPWMPSSWQSLSGRGAFAPVSAVPTGPPYPASKGLCLLPIPS